MYYEISGLVLEVQGGSDYLKSCMSEYTLPLQQERERICDLGISIQENQEIPFPDGERFNEFGIWKMVRTSHGESVYRTLPGMEQVVSARMDLGEKHTDISVFPIDDAVASKRDLLFTGQAFSQMVLEHQRMVLHGSCIAYKGRAIIFSAPSGTGKSTHTELWKRYYPETIHINDDTPVLRLDHPDEVIACGSPWSGKTRLNTNISLPLAAIVFLEQGKENCISPLSKIDAIGRVLGEARKIPFRHAMMKAADLCGMLLERVPVYRLSCDISREAVETVRKELKL